ncbi:MAG: flippase [Candidatus Acidiferrales bacterium]
MQTASTQIQKPEVSRRFFSSTIFNYAGQGFLLVLTFVTAPYTVHRLGVELFGILALVQVTAGFAGVLNLGIGRALTKYVSELYWKGDVQAINQLFQTAWATCMMTGVVALIVLIGPRETIGKLFFRGPEVHGVVDFAIYVAAFGLFSSMLLEAVSAVPAALQRFGICNAVNVLVGTLRSVGPVVVLACGYSIRAVLIIILASNLLAVVAFALVSRGLIPGLNLIPSFSWPAFRKLFTFSLPLLLSALFALIVARVDSFILAYYMPLAAVTFYMLPYSISQKASMGVANITSVVFPFTSELHSMGAHGQVHELYLRSSKILTLVTLPFTVILMVMPEPILRYWLGPEYAVQGAVALCLLGGATFFNAVGAVSTVTSLGVGRAWIPAAFAFAASVINLVSNLLLIPRYGINGAALASLLPQVLLIPVFVYVVARMIEFSLWRLVSQALIRPLMCGAVQTATLLIFRRYVTSLVTLGVLCVASLCVYGVLCFFGAITQEERSAVFRVSSLGVMQAKNEHIVRGLG